MVMYMPRACCLLHTVRQAWLPQLLAQEAKRKLQRGSTPEADVAAAKEAKEEELALPNLTREEVIRRLRALGHPSTLFGEVRAVLQLQPVKVQACFPCIFPLHIHRMAPDPHSQLVNE